MDEGRSRRTHLRLRLGDLVGKLGERINGRVQGGAAVTVAHATPG